MLLCSQDMLLAAVREVEGGTMGQLDVGPCPCSATYSVLPQVSPYPLKLLGLHLFNEDMNATHSAHFTKPC